jgi:hypothetical protein
MICFKNSWGQSNDYSYTFLDSIIVKGNDDALFKGKKKPFLFPPLEKKGGYTLEGLSSVKLDHFDQDSFEHSGVIFKLPDHYTLNSMHWIKLQFYAVNIDSLQIILTDENDRQIHLADIKLSTEQKFYNLEYMIQSIVSATFLFQDTQEYKKIGVVYKQEKRDQELIFNEFTIYDKICIEWRNQNQLVSAIGNKQHILEHNNNFCNISEKKEEKNLGYLEGSNLIFFLKYPIYTQAGSKLENNQISGKSGESRVPNQIESVNSSVRNILINYFDNTENIGLGKDFLSEFDQIIKNATDIDDYYKKLTKQLITLKDPHVKLINNYSYSMRQLTLPLYFYEIKNEIIACGIYDSTLANTISIGDRLLAINNESIRLHISRIAENMDGKTNNARRKKAIVKLLAFCYEDLQDTLHLRFKSVGGYQYSLILNKDDIFHNQTISLSPEIEENRKKFQYKQLDDFAYLKIGVFSESRIRPFIYSVMDSVMDSNGLIIDLRNNPGGDMSEMFFFSFFINKPEKFFTYRENSASDLKTFVVNPDPFYTYTKPIVILINSLTACGAELFLNALQRARNDVITIGSERSAGSAQGAKYLKLPRSKSFNPQFMYRESIVLDANNNNIDLTQGIQPDIWVDINNYQDLAPFKDKILRVGKEVLASFQVEKNNEANNNKSHKLIWILLSICLLIIISLLIILFKQRNLMRDQT